MKDYLLNSTKAYHVDQLDTLGWELTVCNALRPEGTPLRKILTRDNSFGYLLYDYLSKVMPMEKITRILEVGGGYGYLMKDFLERNSTLEPCMLDLSPFLLRKQKETLRGYNVSYMEEDLLETDRAFLSEFDLAVLNENLGDFPVLVNLNSNLFQSPSDITDPILRSALHFFTTYDLEKPEGDFNLNIGALQALEKLCAAGIPYIYMGEHSCEAFAPETLRPFIHIESTGNPERIALKGHDEYTIKFSYLENIARAFNYRTIRGSFADFITFDLTDELRNILLAHGRASDEAEIVCQFIEDLFQYEYTIIFKDANTELP
jgi:hypothetical protein